MTAPLDTAGGGTHALLAVTEPHAVVRSSAAEIGRDRTSSRRIAAQRAATGLSRLASSSIVSRSRAPLDILLFLLVALSAIALVQGGATLLEAVQALAVTGTIVVILVGRRSRALAGRSDVAHEQSFTRILQGLSRSVSPDSVVEAIIEELHTSSGADHVVVARRADDGGTLQVTVMAASATVPVSRTLLRPDVPAPSVPSPSTIPPLPESASRTPPAIRFQEAADEVARRVRSGYGLPYTLAAPLIAGGRFMGALILSKRTRDSWSDPDRQLLTWAATEVSTALARVYALEDAETRANMDVLTGLPNRRYFDELISVVRPHRRAGDDVGFLMIDIDRFKKINDRYGHAVGDIVLRAVAGAIYTTVRADDTPARYGGEEFAVILRRASAPQAAAVAERIRQAVASIPPERLGIEEGVTVSVGVAVSDDPDIEAPQLIARADRALYLAKRRGRDRVEVA